MKQPPEVNGCGVIVTGIVISILAFFGVVWIVGKIDDYRESQKWSQEVLEQDEYIHLLPEGAYMVKPLGNRHYQYRLNVQERGVCRACVFFAVFTPNGNGGWFMSVTLDRTYPIDNLDNKNG